MGFGVIGIGGDGGGITRERFLVAAQMEQRVGPEKKVGGVFRIGLDRASAHGQRLIEHICLKKEIAPSQMRVGSVGF